MKTLKIILTFIFILINITGLLAEKEILHENSFLEFEKKNSMLNVIKTEQQDTFSNLTSEKRLFSNKFKIEKFEGQILIKDSSKRYINLKNEIEIPVKSIIATSKNSYLIISASLLNSKLIIYIPEKTTLNLENIILDEQNISYELDLMLLLGKIYIKSYTDSILKKQFRIKTLTSEIKFTNADAEIFYTKDNITQVNVKKGKIIFIPKYEIKNFINVETRQTAKSDGYKIFDFELYKLKYLYDIKFEDNGNNNLQNDTQQFVKKNNFIAENLFLSTNSIEVKDKKLFVKGITLPNIEVIINNLFVTNSDSFGLFEKNISLDNIKSDSLIFEISYFDKSKVFYVDISTIIDLKPPVIADLMIIPETVLLEQNLYVNLFFTDKNELKIPELEISGPNKFYKKIRLSKVSNFSYTTNIKFDSALIPGEYRVNRVFVSDIKNNIDTILIDKKIFFSNPVPDAVNEINITSKNNGENVILEWRPVSEIDFKEYRIYRSSENDSFILVGKTQNAFFYDTKVLNGKKYNYYVTVVDYADQESNKSEIKSIVPEDNMPPESPQLKRLLVEADYIRLIWDNPLADDVQGYKIYLVKKGEFVKIGETNLDWFDFYYPISNQQYTFAVTAFDKSNHESEKSNFQSVNY